MLERRLHVAAAPNADPPFSASSPGDAEQGNKPPARDWGVIMNSADFLPLLTQLEEDIAMDGADDEDDAILPHQPSSMTSAGRL